jgi:diguanylate cyclase (GGDEF)-like protein
MAAAWQGRKPTVATTGSESLLARVLALGDLDDTSPGVLVPVDDNRIYYLLASEIAGAACQGDEGLYVLVDGETAAEVDRVDSARVMAKQVYVFGSAPAGWNADNLIERPANGFGEHALFLAVISPGLNFAIVGEKGVEGFRGVWTGERDLVARIADLLLTQGGVRKRRQVIEAAQAHGANDRDMACAMRLTMLLTRHLSRQQHDIALDKSDLHSVLDILKAISAKRRAHDILYVFVEQIARAVHMDRCSVVQVWGSDAKGHVLASHEDESIEDLVIDLNRYPEIGHAMKTRQKVVINDVLHDRLTQPFADALKRAGLSSLMVIPVVLYEQNIGTLLLRAARGYPPFSLREMSFCEIVVEAAANALERAHLFESIQRAKEQLEIQAITDGLTGIYNHRYFRQRIEDEFERARRYNLPFSCLIFDVDDFKQVNDTFGHLQGDSVLREIGAHASQAVRKSDIVARYGGEEFVVIMPQTGLEGARTQAERLRAGIGEHLFQGMPPDQRITVSVGVAVYDRETMQDCEAMIRAADGALYRAKREGKNRTIVGEP